MYPKIYFILVYAFLLQSKIANEDVTSKKLRLNKLCIGSTGSERFFFKNTLEDNFLVQKFLTAKKEMPENDSYFITIDDWYLVSGG